MIIRHRLFTQLLCGVAVMIVPAFAGVDSPRPAITSERFGQLPAYFEKNLGQADKAVLFTSRAAGYTLSLTDNAAQFALAGKRIALSFAGANSRAAVAPEAPLEGRSNYYVGNDPRKWVRNVPQFGRVHYRDVYPGVDLTWYGNRQQIEYDFLLAPGADASRIRLRFTGADALSLAENGDLVLKAGGQGLRQLKPAVWQQRGKERVPVEARYVLLSKTEAVLKLANYDHTLPLDIDPVISYSTFLANPYPNNPTLPAAIAVSNGDAYVTGYISWGFPGDSPTSRLFVAKLNAAGSGFVYVTYFGAPGVVTTDQAGGIAVDSVGNAFVTGTTERTNFPTTPGTLQPTKTTGDGDTDAFVLKFGTSGELIWGTYLGGTGQDRGQAIAVDNSGNSYVAGFSRSADFPGAPQACANDVDAFVVSLNPTGSALLNSLCLGGNGEDIANAIALDPQGNVYVAGTSSSTNLPTTQGAFQNSPKTSGQNVFVAKLTGGALDYLTYLGGSIGEWNPSIVVDPTGNAYVTGLTESPDFPTTPGAYDALRLDAFAAGFVTKLNPAGTALVWSTYLSGSIDSTDIAGVKLDSAGNVYVAGTTSSPDFPTTPGAILSSQPSPVDDVFVAKLSADGSRLEYSGTLGSSNYDRATGFARDGDGALYITGTTSSANFPTTPGAFQTVQPGLNNPAGFVTKIDIASSTVCSVTLSANGTTIPSHGGSALFDVTVPDGCPWEAIPDSWITLGPATHGTTSAAVSFTVRFIDSSTHRIGHIVIGPATYTVTQNATSCSDPAFDPTSLSFANTGGQQNINVELLTLCPRLATTSVPWIHIVSGGSGSGSGTVAVSVSPNSSGPRSGTVTIAGKTIPVSEASGPMVALTLQTVGNGILAAAPPSSNGLYIPGTKVCLTASPASGWQFGAWSGTALDASGCLVMNADASVTATFAQRVTLTLTVSPAKSGTVTAKPTATGNVYAAGTKVCLTAKATTGYYLASWSGATLDAQNCFTINANTTVRATFSKPVVLTLAVSPASSGTLSAKPSPVRGTYTPGTKVCLTATPKSGYVFGSWSGAKLDASNCLVLTANATVTAKFVKGYLLTLKSSPTVGGTVTALPAGTKGYYAPRTKVCLTATPRSGYAFSSWSSATLDSGGCLTMSNNLTVTARFVKTP
jgi:hypothetical protein